MLKNIARIILIGALLVFVLFFIWRCAQERAGGGAPSDVPEVKRIIPASWTVLSDKAMACDFDLDGQDEWLVIYRYDQTSVPSSTETSFSPIGGFIYDAEVNLVPQDPALQSPYRPAFLIPFKLLPDMYVGKGQGYLGETDVEVIVQPGSGGSEGSGTSSPQCQSEEINVLGFSGSPYSAGNPTPTRLSIFRWGGESIGYAGVSFVGNARVEALPGATQPITGVVTYNRLNDRSVLCAVQTFDRQDPVTPVEEQPLGTGQTGQKGLPTAPPVFTEQPALYTIGFCFGAPSDPAYPEGVVVALLQGQNPNDDGENPSPTGNSYLTADGLASLPPELGNLEDASDKAYPILSITYPGALMPAPGFPCPITSGVTTPESGIWWCGSQQVEVVTDLLLEGRSRLAVWTLISMASDKATAGVFWRVDKVEVR